jgi:hypothetical protein
MSPPSTANPFPRLTSVLRCPICGHEQEEIMPTDTCRIVYTCPACQTVLHPQPGDCCVFCSYGTVPCPPVQLETQARGIENEGPMPIIALQQALDPLISTFNALHESPRLLALVSPTCPECVFGAESVRHVVEVMPSLQALLVWLPMLDSDTPATIDQTATRFVHPRIHRFADPHRLAGTHIARRLSDGDWIAWDCYLLYAPGVMWEHDLPLPNQWFHQLDGKSTDPARQRCGPALLPALEDGVQQLTH